MKISKEELKEIIKEEVVRFQNIKKQIQEELRMMNENKLNNDSLDSLDVDDNKLDKIEDKVKSELDKNEDLKKLAIKAIKSLHKDTGLSLSDMKDREKVFNTLVSLNEISIDQISKTTAALFTALSTGSGAIGAAMKIVGGVDPQANASLTMAALAAGIAAYFWNYSKRVDKNP